MANWRAALTLITLGAETPDSVKSPERDSLYARAERKMLGQGTAILCLSSAMQQIALKHYELAQGQSYVLINGVDLDRFDPSGREKARSEVRQKHKIGRGDVVALLMSNNYRLKGLRQAIGALQGLVEAGRKNARLMVVGREPIEPYRRLARRLGIESHRVLTREEMFPGTVVGRGCFGRMKTAVDDGLIGGVTAKIGSTVYDGLRPNRRSAS